MSTPFMNWLRTASENLKTSESISPTEPVGEGEGVIGKIDDPMLQRMLILRLSMRQELDKFATAVTLMFGNRHSAEDESKPEHDPATCQRCDMRRKFARLTDKMTTLDHLYWGNLHSTLDDKALDTLAAHAGGMALRTGWQVVAYPPEQTMPAGALVLIEEIILRRPGKDN